MNKKIKNKIISFFLALIALIGLILYFNITLNNILLFPFLYFLYVAFDRIMLQKMNKKDFFYCGILSFLYSSILIIGTQLDLSNMIIYNLKTIVSLICLPFFIFILVYRLFSFFNNYKVQKSETKLSIKSIKLLTFCGILIPWFLGFLALFPGIYGYDAGFQFMQFDIENAYITSHFSILYSYLFYTILNIGKIIFNSYQIGFAIYSFLQMLFLTFVSYKICYYLYNKFKSFKVLIFSICLFALSPFNMILALSSCQDAIFAGLFALIILFTLQMIENNKTFWSNWKNSLIYFILVFLLCAIRNNGLYAFIFIIPFYAICSKENRLKFILLSFLTICIFFVYKGPFHNLLEIKKGNSIQEMSSVIVQQIGRVYCYKRDTLTENEKEYILTLIPEESLEKYQYTPCISDNLKVSLNSDFLKSDYKKFIKTYISIGIKNPKTYLEAFLLNNIGSWYPNKTYPDSRMYHPYAEYEMLDAKMWNPDYIIIERTSLFPIYEKVLNVFVNKSQWNKIPLVSTLLSTGTYFCIFLFVIFKIFYNKRFKYLIPLSLIFGLYMTVFLAPVSLYRYIYPIILCIPLLLSTILDNNYNN